MMQSLVQQLRIASKRSADPDLGRLLADAVEELERLQRAAYRASSARPIDFDGVRAIRRRHDAIDADDLQGRARQAHADRAHLLAILAFTSDTAMERDLQGTAEPPTLDIPVDEAPFVFRQSPSATG